MTEVEFRVLGPIEAVHASTRLTLGGSRPRTVLAMLLLRHGHWVSVDALIDGLWGGSPPVTAAKTVQKYISHLRAALGDPNLIISRPEGYELAAQNVDSRQFDLLIDRAAAAAPSMEATQLLTQALALWRGEPYGDLPELVPAEAERRRLHERRLEAIESLVDIRLALGEHTPLVSWLEELVTEHPLRERLWGALMLALYRAGRQADALAAYGRVRSLLVDELGAEPTPALRAVHELVLRQADVAPRPVSAPLHTETARTSAHRGQARRSRMPLRLTTLIGRDRELADLTELLAGQRLVTLVGAAGSGKTRLALELLDHAATAQSVPSSTQDDGAGWLVELSGVTEQARVVTAVANTLRLREQPGVDLLDVVADHLADARGLLVFDNCEHLVDAVAALVSTVLRAAPAVRVLATSRRSLGVEGEIVYEVPPLAVPETDEPDDVARSEAVRLLVVRARSADPRFTLHPDNTPAVARIVRRLDGLPLAIELAAARMRYFGAAGLADLLDDRFRVLVSNVRDRPARHQTLRAAVAWSYDLLNLAERRLFRALTVFEGGFVLDAAERVNDEALQLLPDLVDRSLVVVEAGPRGTRYRVLETLREYGRAQLEPEEAGQVRLRHLLWALDLAETTVPMVPGPGYVEALEILDVERDNLWAALWWALRHGRREEALRLSTSLTLYWDERACFDEGLAVLREALASGTDLPAPLRSAAYSAGARLALGRADHDAATDLAQRSLVLAQECGHEPARWRAQELLGMTALYQGDYQSALRLLDECRTEYERLGLASDHACVVGRLGQVHRLRGDYPAARAALEECLALRERIGDVNGRAWTLWQLGVVARYEGGRSEAAAGYYRDALAAFDAVGDAGGAAHVRYSLGDLARVAGDRSGATELYEASLAVLRTHGDRRCVASVHYNLGLLALADSTPRDDGDSNPRAAADTSDATEHLRRSLEIRRDLNDRAGVAQCLEALAVLADREGELVTAVRLLAEGAQIRAMTGAASPVDEEHTRSALVSSLRQRLGPTTFNSLWPAVAIC